LPPLSQLVFPGDRVLLVPDADYAEKPEILAEIVAVLLENGFNAQDVQILLTDSEEIRVARLLQNHLPSEVRLLFHRPSQPNHHALLGVNENNEPITLCRDLIDADLVISVCRFYSKQPQHHFGIHSAIFPRFSNTETQHRFAETKNKKLRRLQAEVEEVARLLGVIFTIQFRHERGKQTKIAAGLPELVVKTLRNL
jgi:hypothetical protein